MPDLLIIADSIRSPDMRHAVPVAIGDPFLYAERDGRASVLVASFERERVEALAAGLDVRTFEDAGVDELLTRGLSREEVGRELWLNACRLFGIERAAVPRTFPLGDGDHLRANGIELTVDQGLFDARRRRKNPEELAGIRRAQRAAEAGMAAGLDLLRRAVPANGGLAVDGDPLTCELLKLHVERAFGAHGASADEFIVSHGAQTAVGHDMGSGPIGRDDVVLFDLFPRDRESGCFADMTRTFALGEPADEIREYHRLCREALDRATAAVRPGARGREIHRLVCDFLHEHGHPTQLHKADGEVLEDGMYHATGHGVGLDVHEEPGIGRIGAELVAGDVIALEPGLYRHGHGGVRLEDIVLVTEDGAEILTEFPYDLKV